MGCGNRPVKYTQHSIDSSREIIQEHTERLTVLRAALPSLTGMEKDICLREIKSSEEWIEWAESKLSRAVPQVERRNTRESLLKRLGLTT